MTPLLRLATGLALLLAAADARAERPRLRCEAAQLGPRTVARAELSGFFEPELLRLIRLGLQGRVRVDARVLRRRTAWFDDVVATYTQDLTVTWDTGRKSYLLNGAPAHPSAFAPLRLERIPLGRRQRSGDHYVEVSAKLEVVTLASLRGAANWVTGRGDEPALSRQLARIVVEDLVRKASTSCDAVRR